jgi:hypothetical protein
LGIGAFGNLVFAQGRSIKGYQYPVFAQSPGEDIRGRRGRTVFGNPGNFVAGIT